MDTPRPPRDIRRRYLQRLGNSWYARVRVPPSLVGVLGNTHLRQALHTSDLNKANRIKWPIIQALKAKIDRCRGITPAETLAGKYRQSIRQAASESNTITKDALEDLAIEHAEEIEKESGPLQAKRWYDLATTVRPTLDELLEEWLTSKPFSSITALGYRSAYKSFRDWYGGDALPESVTDDIAHAYVQTVVQPLALALSTKRHRVIRLAAFWKWLGAARKIPRGPNPWHNHLLTDSRPQSMVTGPAPGDATGPAPQSTAQGARTGVLFRKPSSADTCGGNPTGNAHGSGKRPFTEPELVSLLGGGIGELRPSTGKPRLPDLGLLMILAMYTGARLDSLCSMPLSDIDDTGEALFLHFHDKTKAGHRRVPLVNPTAVALVRRRMLASESRPRLSPAEDAPQRLALGSAHLFPKFNKPGLKSRSSHAVSVDFIRHRRRQGLGEDVSFHSFRKTVATVLENSDIDYVRAARVLGWQVPTMMHQVYSGGLSPARLMEVAQAIRYSPEVETAVEKLGALLLQAEGPTGGR